MKCTRCGHHRASHTDAGQCHALSAEGQCDCPAFVPEQERRQHTHHGGLTHTHFIVEGALHEH